MRNVSAQVWRRVSRFAAIVRGRRYSDTSGLVDPPTKYRIDVRATISRMKFTSSALSLTVPRAVTYQCSATSTSTSAPSAAITGGQRIGASKMRCRLNTDAATSTATA